MADRTIRSQVGRFSMVPAWVIRRVTELGRRTEDGSISRAIHLYAVLAGFADARERRAWPSIDTLAETMASSRRSVERAVALLRSAGAIETERHHRRDGAVLGLHFVLVQVDPEGPVLPATGGGKGKSDQTATDGGKGRRLPATGGGAFPPPMARSSERILITELEPENKNQERAPAETPDASASMSHFRQMRSELERDLVEEFRELWNNRAAGTPLKTVEASGLTKRRRRAIRAALVERPLEDWRGILNRLALSSFLTGAARSGWTPSIDWILNPENVVKLLEGQYDDTISERELDEAEDYAARRLAPRKPGETREDYRRRWALLLRDTRRRTRGKAS